MGAQYHRRRHAAHRRRGRRQAARRAATVLPDRIETGTYAMAVAMTGGDVQLLPARGRNCCNRRSMC
jgi:UDP-N-acetylglucosamine enolpyruvyl transferase